MGVKNTLSVYFAKWIIKIILVGLLILLFNIIFVTWGIGQHLFLPANAPIKKAEEIKNEIVKTDTIDSSLIPSELDFAIFDKQTNTLIESNMSSKNIQNVEKAFLNARTTDELTSFIKYETPYEMILIHYNLKIQFANIELRRVFPNPGVLLASFSILVYVIYLIWNIRSFSHTIIQENEKLIIVTNKIKERDLNFEFPKVRFTEYTNVMEAMESLSEALVESIQKEIQITNSKTEQINYLIHDIKIPLTIIKGNTELLKSMITNDNLQESFYDIMNSITQIERYIQDVIDINLNNKQVELIVEEVSVNDFLHTLAVGVKSLGTHVLLEDYTERDTNILIDPPLFIRAINNIVLNGIERTPAHERLQIKVTQSRNLIHFTITDYGPGFSEESLKKAAELFYTENNGRTSNNHYGLGLTFAKKIINQHNGKITLKNTPQHSGEVLVEIPIYKHK
ncbi:sensor histidine kinase [Lysinibacillus sp. 3P01SB]|uniref:sensor histidine kinase n=1 Tax=Lysinibacillus sp. 3P01SB TaxID=3132284 RepID=UPI0039A60339